MKNYTCKHPEYPKWEEKKKNKEVNQMPKEEREYKQVEGVLLIQPNGNIFVGKEQMQDGDIIRIPTETLKKIISDAHSGYI